MTEPLAPALVARVASELSINPQQVRSTIDKHFDIESIEFPTAKDIDIHRQGEGWVMVAEYEGYAPLFANIALVIDFRKEVELR